MIIYDDIEFDEHTPLCLMPRDVQEFAAWIAILPPEAIEQIRLKIEELSKKDRYKNKNNQDKKHTSCGLDLTKLTSEERAALEEAEAYADALRMEDNFWDD